MNHIEQVLKEFEENYVFVPPPESHPTGRILLRPFELKGTVGDIKFFLKEKHLEYLRKEVERLREKEIGLNVQFNLISKEKYREVAESVGFNSAIRKEITLKLQEIKELEELINK